MRSEIQVRKAKIKDVPAIAKLEYQLNLDHAKLDQFYKMKKDALKTFRDFSKKRIYRRDQRLIVAEDRGRIVGTLNALIEKRPPIFVEKYAGLIGCAYIEPKYRRKRIGQAMHKEALAWFRQKGVRTVELEAHRKNPKGVSAWTKYGYIKHLHRMRKGV